jgi:Fe-S-cluster-containing hydrogenase component 2
MKRKIVNINEDLCNGCGQCIMIEGALQIVNGSKIIKNIATVLALAWAMSPGAICNRSETFNEAEFMNI